MSDCWSVARVKADKAPRKRSEGRGTFRVQRLAFNFQRSQGAVGTSVTLMGEDIGNTSNCLEPYLPTRQAPGEEDLLVLPTQLAVFVHQACRHPGIAQLDFCGAVTPARVPVQFRQGAWNQTPTYPSNRLSLCVLGGLQCGSSYCFETGQSGTK
jgi:hypothetical protein